MSDFDRDEAFYAALNGQLARDCLAAASRRRRRRIAILPPPAASLACRA